MANAIPFVEGKLEQRKAVLFCKTYSPESKACQAILRGYPELTEDYLECVAIEKRGDCSEVEDYLHKLSGKNNREVPLLFVDTRCVGGYSEIIQMQSAGRLKDFIKDIVSPRQKKPDDDDPIYRYLDLRVRPLDDTEIIIKIKEVFTKTAGIDCTTETDFDPLHVTDSNMSVLSGLSEVLGPKGEGDETVLGPTPPSAGDLGHEADGGKAGVGGVKGLRLNYLRHKMEVYEKEGGLGRGSDSAGGQEGERTGENQMGETAARGKKTDKGNNV
ncbi:uncharacterized protein LOC101849008 [Aplysia californica]|uniref:Uncharacterized protein LOC101849008 n=1 Tax=Aplysia californica TaxID=6500 RepID=A0ABM0K661_APLCA|nr:uncharacterized protein LOC101849008 [Aplysia californica]